MRSAWTALKKGALSHHNLGGTPGAIMVLHTFGSDLKYHIHAHCLVTFGGIDKSGQWKWPKRKNKIIPFRQLRATFRAEFIHNLINIYPALHTLLPLNVLQDDLMKKQWCVNQQPPTTNTSIIEQYLGKYICRVGLSKNRFHYDHINQSVTISFKDYRNTNKNNRIAPQATKTMIPLLAINQILQHALPPYFQKCRYYGLHASASLKKYRHTLPHYIKNNSDTIRTVFQIIKLMMGLKKMTLSCPKCEHLQFEKTLIKPDKSWIIPYLNIPKDHHNRGSPYPRKDILPPFHLRHIRSNRALMPSINDIIPS